MFSQDVKKLIERDFIECVIPLNTLHVFHHYNTNVLTSRDIETVKMVTKGQGKYEGASDLLNRLCSYEGWFECLLQVLRDPCVKQAHLADALERLVEPLLQEDSAFKTKEVDILLVGKTGSGKSATGNSILQKQAFDSKPSMSSVTKDVQVDYAEFEGTKVKVVDGPGVGDTGHNEETGYKFIVDSMSKAIAVSTEGYHVMLVTLSMDQRFTKEDINSIEILKRIFGPDFIKKHAILLLTHGDNFSNADDAALERWCLQQEGNFKKLYEECGRRSILFDNKTNDVLKKKTQIRQLLKMIDSLIEHGQRYDNQVFQEARHTRDRVLADPRTPILSEDILKEFAFLTQQMKLINLYEPEKENERLRLLLKRVEMINEKIQKESPYAKKISNDFLKKIEKSIFGDLDLIKNILRTKQEDEQKVQSVNKEDRREDMAKKQNLLEKNAISQENRYRELKEKSTISLLAKMTENIMEVIMTYHGQTQER